jgi:TPR repeat protein
MSKSLMYRRGWGGLPKDDVQAASWYLKAAEAGSAIGMNNIGFLYENGIGGLPKSAGQAISWRRKAANFGQAQAEASLKRLRDVASNAAGT